MNASISYLESYTCVDLNRLINMYMYVYILYVTPQNDFAVDSLIPKFLHAITTLSSIIYICIDTFVLFRVLQHSTTGPQSF